MGKGTQASPEDEFDVVMLEGKAQPKSYRHSGVPQQGYYVFFSIGFLRINARRITDRMIHAM